MFTDPERYRPGPWIRLRLCLMAGGLLALLGALCYRAYVLQVRQSHRLRALAKEQYLHEVELPPRRGRILDRNGAELAASAEVDSVYANPRVVGDRAPEVATALARVLHVDRRDLERRLGGRRYFSWLARRVTSEEARAVRDLDEKGVFLAKEPRRFYPHRALAGPLLGWAGLDAVGQEGLELEYDHWLRGQRSEVSGVRDALGREVLLSGLGDWTAQAGHDVHTTLDRYIQFRLEVALKAAVAAHRAHAGVAVALDPRNGEILAMAAVPTMNPNSPEDGRLHGARNRAVTDVFEPGSTMKTFAIAGAIEAGVVRPSDTWDCEHGHFKIGGRTIHDAEPIGEVTTTGVLAKSSNIGAAKIAEREGRERLHDILLRFGFGRPTGVDLPGERAGQIRSVAHMGPVETATMAFGQGLSATALQIAAGYVAIANGGIWYRPHVMREIVDGAGEVVKRAQIDGHRVISAALATTMRRMLVAVTQKGGTAEKLTLPGYTFAGKTGTAQEVDPATHRYSKDRWDSSFVGFAPLDDPRIVLYVMIDSPADTHYGAIVAGPVWEAAMADALRWLGVPPDAPIVEARKKIVPKPLPLVPMVAEVSDENDDEPPPRGATAVPDFTGMSVGEALQAAERAGLRVQVVGSGLATAQSPGPGAARRGVACRVSFSPPG